MYASRKVLIASCLLAGAVVLGAGAGGASAQCFYYPAAAYVPPPVVYAPPPVYCVPAPVYCPPAPVYYVPTYRSFSFGWYSGGGCRTRSYAFGFGYRH